MAVFWEEFVKVWTNFQNFIENFDSFKENFNKNLGKFDETLNFLLLSILIAAEAWDIFHHLQIFPGFGGKLPPCDATGIN